MEISNPELRTLDERTAEFHKLSARYTARLVNLYGREEYKAELSNILDQADSVTPETEFDDLVLRNIKSNLKLNDLTTGTLNSFPIVIKSSLISSFNVVLSLMVNNVIDISSTLYFNFFSILIMLNLYTQKILKNYKKINSCFS